MSRLFATAIVLSASLLFVVQPLVAKSVLPVLGGSPAVWSTSLVFFQTVLLAGYVYAHALATYVAGRWQLAVHATVLVAAGLTLMRGHAAGAPHGDPRWWLVQTLLITIGLPLFALSATAPLLQKWYSRTHAPGAQDPYFLYAASNAGSLAGLFGYLLVEVAATRAVQTTGWMVGFWAAALLIIVCGANAAPASGSAPADRRSRVAATPAIGRSTYGWWLILSLVPSALLVGVTHHLSTDVVAAPLLWVVPLAMYLTTYIAAFSRRGGGAASAWGRVAPAGALLVLVLWLADLREPIVLVVAVHLAAFGVFAMMCHTRLAELRPHPAHLTTFYLCVAAGGALGAALVALVAPVVFSTILEYPLAIAAALLVRPQTRDSDRRHQGAVRWRWRMGAALLYVGGVWLASPHRLSVWVPALTEQSEVVQRAASASLALPALILAVPYGAALLFAAMTAGLLAGASIVRTDGALLYRERTFFGVHHVTSVQAGAWHVLTHGTTTHGLQATSGRMKALPTTYYHPTGPIGDVVFTLAANQRLRDIAAVGLGAGSLAAYAGKDVRLEFFEVDNAVVRIAENERYFTYLADARRRPGVTVRTHTMDGRLGLAAAADGSYDLIVIDAFSSDAIPVHLVTREAVRIYRSKLKPHGAIAFHISSRYFDLSQVLADIAGAERLVCYARIDAPVPPERRGEGMRPSYWVVLSGSDADLGEIAKSAPRWVRRPPSSGRLWTDDYSNILGILQ